MIEKIIKGRLDDHQFNDCDLTMRELDIVAKTLKETVMGIFHSESSTQKRLRNQNRHHLKPVNQYYEQTGVMKE